MYDLIIVGAGPAGLSCALYALRANKKVLVLEAKNYGGQIVKAHKVENYPALPSVSGVDFANNLYKQVVDLGVELKFETVTRIEEDKTVITNNGSYSAKAIVLATGVGNKKLQLENEDKFIGKGVSYCATCDGNFYKGKTVAVIGGGNTALEDALYLTNLASKIYIIHRRDTFKGEDKYLEDLKNCDNVEFILNSNVVKINGEDFVESIDIKDADENISTINIDGLFIAVGQEPRNKIFSDLIEIDDAGYIISEDGVHTNVEGIYVAGDARVKKLRLLATAVADGAIAATTAIEEMREKI